MSKRRCDQDKIHCSKRCSLSFIRIRTGFKASLGLVAASIFWFVPQTFIILDPSWTVLMVVLVAISLSASHSLGGSIQSAKYLLASGILAAVPNLIFYTVTRDNLWLGIGIFFFWTAFIGLLYVAADPTLTHITCIRFVALNFSMVLIFPPKFDAAARNYYYSPPVQNLIMMVVGYLFCVVAVLVFPTRWVIKLPNEFSHTLKRCNKMFELLVRLSRLPKKTMELPKLQELIAEGDSMASVKKSIFHEELRREIDQEKVGRLSQKLIKEVGWLYSVLSEAKLERWVNPEIFAAEEEIIRKLDGLVGHLTTMRIALGHGFIKTTVHDIFPKLMPQFDLLQNRFYAHIDDTRQKLTHVFSKQQRDYGRVEELDTILIEASTPNLIRAKKNGSERPLRNLVDVISDEYIQQIKDMEDKGDLQVIPTNEVARMNFYLWRLIELVDKLQAIEEAVTQFGEKLRVDRTWQYRHAIGHVLAYPFYDMFLVMRELLSATGKPQRAYLQGLKQIWHNEQWKYPVRLAFIVSAVSVASIFVSAVLPNVRAHWTSVTMIVIITPSVGATLKRGIHRIIGTIIGAGVAWLTLIMATYANPIAILLSVAFVFCFIATYLQYSSLYQKPYSMVVAVLTFLVIAFSGYPNIDYNDWGPPLFRFLNILAGVIIGILATLPFPVLALRRLRASFISTAQKSASILQSTLLIDELTNKHEDITKCVKEINTMAKLQSRLLKEAKAELYFNQRKRKTFIRITEHMANLAFLLLAVEEVCRGGFSQQMIEEVYEPLRQDFAYISEVAEIQVHLFKEFMTSDRLHPAHQVAAKKIKRFLKKIQRRHERTRKHEVDLKKLHKLHPEMIKFNAFLYTISSLIQEWRKMMDLASDIKKKKRKL